MSTCTSTCWTQVMCSTCHMPKAPRGRSVPLEAANGYCDDECPGYSDGPVPHLWSVHDSTRSYSDPEGWAEHEANCEACRQDDGASR